MASFARQFNPGIYHDTTVCALVLEDNPVGPDSRLAFDSFPGEIEENYGVSYQGLGADRMPQPRFVAYRGGNWTSFTLQLIFRAGRSQGEMLQQFARVSPQLLSDAQLQQLLIDMEHKVRWCQALAFPLERQLGATDQQRILGDPEAGGGFLSSLAGTTEKLNNLRRNDPPIVLVVFGSWWVQRAYVENVSVKWTGPWHPTSVRPYGAEVNLTMIPIKAVYPTWQLIRRQAGRSGYDSDNQSPLIRGVVDSSRQSTSNRVSAPGGA